MSELAAQDNERLALWETFPEQCRLDNCPIARLAVSQVVEGKLPFIAPRAAECTEGLEIIGERCTKKSLCGHPGSGNTDDFDEQINNLVSYLILE